MSFDLKRFLFKRNKTIRGWMLENNLTTQEDVELALKQDDLVATTEDDKEIKHLLKSLIKVKHHEEPEQVSIPVIEVHLENDEEDKTLSSKSKKVDDKKETN